MKHSSPVELFLRGALRLELRGPQAANIIMLLQQKGIRMYDVRVSGGRVYLVIGLREFTNLYRVCRATKVKIRFLGREGLPFILRNSWRRKSMLAGCALFFSLMYVLSSMIWEVRVTGVKEETGTAILQTAHDLGISVGSWKSVLNDVDDLQDKIIQKMPNLVWIGITHQGVRVKFDALEQVPGVTQGSVQPHNIVASKPAVIRKVFANRGEVMVKPGQVVHPGQLVISGDLAGGAKQVPAEGKVLAEVWYTSSVSLPLSVKQSGLTGESVEHDYIAIGPFTVRVWGFKQPQYAAAEQRSRDTEWRLWNWMLPVQLRKVTVYEAYPFAVASSEKQAEKNALSVAGQDVRSKMHRDGIILGQTVLHREVSHGKLYETILTQTEEDIGMAAPIQTSSPNEQSQS